MIDAISGLLRPTFFNFACASVNSESPEMASSTSFKVFDESSSNFLKSYQEVVNTNFRPIFSGMPSNDDKMEKIRMNNIILDSETVLLEPLFSDMPSVSHKFTRKVLDILIFFLITMITMMLFLMIIIGDLISDDSVYIKNNICDSCVSYCIGNRLVASACSSDSDTIADPQMDYTNLYNFLNLFIQSTKFVTLRSHVELDRWGRPGVWFEDLYDFSKWKHFTTGRIKTQVQTKNGIFTYSELPSFPQDKTRIRGPKIRRIRRDAMVSSLEPNLPENESNRNPRASQFNGYFKGSDFREHSEN